MYSFCRSALNALTLFVFLSQAGYSTESAEIPQVIDAAWRADKPTEILSGKSLDTTEVVINEPGASFIKLHFSKFVVPRGVTIEVSNAQGTERYQYSSTKTTSRRTRKANRTLNADQGDDGYNSFSTMSISGDTAVIRILGDKSNVNALKHRVFVDYYMVGYPEDGEALKSSTKSKTSSMVEFSGDAPPKTMDQCGINDRRDAVCFESSNADEYFGSMPVAKILVNGSRYCTAWRVGPENHLFTNQHCIRTEAEVASTEVWFDYERSECGQSAVRETIKVTGSQWLASDQLLDYTLFSVNDFNLISAYGHFGLEVGDLYVGDSIYIPQHGGGQPKQIALDSDMNLSGQCEIDDTDHWGLDYYVDTDIGYYCDTRDGSSGSPVVLRDSNKVVALHHLGGCFNKGAKMSLIWPQVSEYFGGIVPGGDGEPEPNQAPNASLDFVCNELTCDFDGSGSSDADGQIVNFSWYFEDGGSLFGPLVSHTFASAGTYTVELTIEDDGGAQSSSQAEVTVDLSNVPPSAAFSVDCTDLSCNFNAGLSSDNDGQITNYAWDFGDGTSAQGVSETASHDFSADGDYLVRLDIVDDKGGSATAQSSIAVSSPPVNVEPVADYSYTCTNLSCVFDASQSSDPDGSIAAYRWDFGEGEASESGGPVKNHAYAQPGNYQVMLEIVDNQGAISTQAATITVSAPPVNEEPVASYSYTCTNLSCVFDASQSSDPDGSIAAYRWNFSEGEASESGGPVKNHTFVQPGSYQVMLEIEDNQGAVSTQSATVTVSAPPANQEPIAGYSFTCTELSCVFDASASNDPDGNLVAYRWNFGQNEASESGGPVKNHTFAQAGDYQVTLEVEDNAGAISSHSAIVSITIVVPPGPSDIQLSAEGNKHRGSKWADLTWSDAAGSEVDIFRDGALLSTVTNNGEYADSDISNKTKSAAYRICEAGSSNCSEEVTANF